MTDIDVEKFEEVCSDDSLSIKMSSEIYQNLVRFFLRYEQGAAYHVSGDAQMIQSIFADAEEVYAKFGIFCADVSVWDEDDIHKICIINSIDEIVPVIKQFTITNGFAPEFVAVLEDVGADAVTVINDVAPNCIVFNAVSSSVQSNGGNTRARNNSYKYVDITYLFEDKVFNSAFFDLNVSNARKVLDDVRALPKDPLTIFCVEDTLTEDKLNVYLCIASILTFEGFNFELSRISQGLFVNYQRDALSKDYMMLHEYLWKIANPVTFGVMQSKNSWNVCVLNHENKTKYTPKDFPLRFYSIQFTRNDGTSALDVCSLKEVEMMYSSIDFLDPIEIFNLDGTKEQVYSNHFDVCNLITEFEELIQRDYTIPFGMSLNFTNVFFYSTDEGMFMAFLPNLPEVTYSYTFIPLCPSYKAFKNTIGIREYDKLLDINVLTERDALINQLSKYTFDCMRHFKRPRFINGLLLNGVHASNSIFTDECGLTFTEVGVWSTQSSQVRISAGKILLERFDSIKLHEKRFLTFWGGCHPMDLTKIYVDFEVWRGTQNEQ